jgi:hypothetical protein
MEINRNRRGETEVLRARIEEVDSINVVSVNVLERNGTVVTCEVEIEAELSLDIEAEVEGFRYGLDGYEPSRRFSVHQWRTENFYPEVIANFDSSTGSLEFESIGIGYGGVSVSADEIEHHHAQWSRHR